MGNVIALAAAYYTGVVVTRQEQSASPAKVKTVSASTPVVIKISSPTSPSNTNANVDANGLPPNSAAAKLSPDELQALLQNNSTAVAYARDITGKLDFNNLVIRIAKKWAVDDPRGVLAWAQGLPTGIAQEDAVRLIFTLFGKTDPAGALALAQSLPDDSSNIRTRALDGLAAVAITTSFQDPAQAAAMLNTLDRNEAAISIENPTAMVAGSWYMHDSAAATQWINNLPVGNTKDSAVLAVVMVTGDSDPATAFSWLRTMSNPGKRGTTTTALITQWAKKDPAAATTAVMQAYPNNRNGRQATLLGIIQQSTPAAPASQQ